MPVKMRYKLSFINELRALGKHHNDLLYLEEIKEICNKHNLGDLFNSKIASTSQYRWSVKEIFRALEHT